MGNEYFGDAANVVQAGAVYGDVHVGGGFQPPAQLPGEPEVFVDREQPLASLNTFLAAESGTERARSVVISGPGGAGKSALALHWLYGIKSRFEDGQVYFDFQEYGREVGLCEIAQHCLRAVGVGPELLPSNTGEALGMLRTWTGGRKMAFLFDNVPAPHELGRLALNSPDALVVITSHRRTGRSNGGGYVEIGQLASEHALRVLDQKTGGGRVDAEPESAARIVALCGAMPLALHVVAERIARRPKWALRRAVDQLADEDRRLDRMSYDEDPILRNALDFAYSHLSEQRASLYRQLGAIPGPSFSVPAVSALTGCDPEDVEDELDDLRLLSLVECDDQEQYRFHELVRLHARAFSANEDPDAVFRLAQWYRLQGAFADRAVLEPARLRVGGDDELVAGKENPFDHDSGSRWLVRERSNILAVLRESVDRGWYRIAISLCDSPLWALHQQYKYYSDMIEALELAVTAAEREQDLVAQARMRTLLVRLHMELHDFESAHDQAQRAGRLAEQAGHRRVQASAAEFHGRVYLEQGSWEEARPLFEFARSVNEELGKPRAVALQEHFLGQVEDGLGQHEKALRTLRTALERLSEFPKDRRIPSRIRVSMGKAHQNLARHEEAIDVLHRALSDMAAAGASFDRAKPLELLARSLTATGATETAEQCWQQALRIYQQVGSPEAELLRSRGE